MSGELPRFPYHPDPVASGSVKPSDALCVSCGNKRGYIYVGPVYSVDELAHSICPWCIADGSAAERYEAQFTDFENVSSEVAPDVIKQILTRTPGFVGWQQEHWMFHCGDGAAFLGPAGYKELLPFPDAVDVLRHERDGYGWPLQAVEEYLTSLRTNGSPTAYHFECRHCATHIAYSDFT